MKKRTVYFKVPVKIKADSEAMFMDAIKEARRSLVLQAWSGGIAGSWAMETGRAQLMQNKESRK